MTVPCDHTQLQLICSILLNALFGIGTLPPFLSLFAQSVVNPLARGLQGFAEKIITRMNVRIVDTRSVDRPDLGTLSTSFTDSYTPRSEFRHAFRA